MPTVRNILDRKGRDVVTTVAAEKVVRAARLMNDRGIGGLVVMDGAKLIGIFTERDVMRRVVAEARDPGRTTIGEVMSTPVAHCGPDTTLDECRAMMTERRIRHVPVIEGDLVCGIVTSGDILAYQIAEQRDQIEYLNAYVTEQR
jgi:CBS domain-containing protein